MDPIKVDAITKLINEGMDLTQRGRHTHLRENENAQRKALEIVKKSIEVLT